MAILEKNKQPDRKREIDLSGPEGNAMFLIGQARQWGKQMGLDVEKLTEEMMSGDYENLIDIFDREFGSICNLLR